MDQLLHQGPLPEEPSRAVLRVAAVTTFSKRRGSKELELWYRIAFEAAVDVLVLPSSFLPHYGTPSAFYTKDEVTSLSQRLYDINRGLKRYPQPTVIVGVNEISGDLKFKSVAVLRAGEVVFWHRKHVLENHYIQKGYTRGPHAPICFTQRDQEAIHVCPMECFEVLQPALWPRGVGLVTASIGFGMKAKTANYECDYWDQWLSVVRANCLLHSCYAVLSCNGKHDDAMTAVITPGGEVQASLRSAGILITDINYEFTAKDRLHNPYRQEQ